MSERPFRFRSEVFLNERRAFLAEHLMNLEQSLDLARRRADRGEIMMNELEGVEAERDVVKRSIQLVDAEIQRRKEP